MLARSVFQHQDTIWLPYDEGHLSGYGCKFAMNAGTSGNHAGDYLRDMLDGVDDLLNVRKALSVDMAESVTAMRSPMLAE